METMKKENIKLHFLKSEDSEINKLTESISLLPEFIIEPLKDYIKEEVTYRLAHEMDFLIEKKIDPNNKRHTIQHIIIMLLLLMLIATIFIVKIV